MVAVVDPGLLRLTPRRLGIVTENLQLHLDAGDADSYAGSGQYWLDLVNSYDAIRGLSPSVETQDPNFNGTPGGMSASEYFYSDGNDEFTFAAHSGSILRKLGSTVQSYTVELVAYKTGTNDGMLLSNNVSNGTAGLCLRQDYSSANTVSILDGSSSLVALSGSDFTSNAWHWIAIKGKWDGATPNTFWIDGAQSGSSYTKTGNFSTGDSVYPMKLWARADSNVRLGAGTRLAMVRMYDIELSEADLLRNWAATRGRFGI